MTKGRFAKQKKKKSRSERKMAWRRNKQKEQREQTEQRERGYIEMYGAKGAPGVLRVRSSERSGLNDV